MVICLCLLSVGGVCYAYFTKVSNHSHSGNTASMATALYSVTKGSSYTIGSQYTGTITADASTTRSFAVKNTSDIEVFLRVNYVIGVYNGTKITPLDNSYYTSTIYSDTLNVTYSGGNNTFAGWTLVENGWYYYNASIEPGQYIPFGQIVRNSTAVSNAVIKLAVEVVQCTEAVRNIWNPSMTWQSSSFIHLDAKYSADGVDLRPYWGSNMTGKELVPILPDGDGWKTTAPLGETDSINTSNSLMIPLAANNTDNPASIDITNLTGINNNNYLRVYNASKKLMMISANFNMILMTSNDKGATWTDATALWAEGNYFENLTVGINFVDNSQWIDVRQTTSRTFDNNTGSVAYVYNGLVQPGESIQAILSPATVSGIKGLLDSNNKYNNRLFAIRISLTISGVESIVVDGVNTVEKSLDYTSNATGFFRDQVDNYTANATTLSNLANTLTSQYTRWLTIVGLLDDTPSGASNNNDDTGVVM